MLKPDDPAVKYLEARLQLVALSEYSAGSPTFRPII